MKLGSIKFSVIKTSARDTFQIQFGTIKGKPAEWFDTDSKGVIEVFEYVIETFGVLDAPTTKEMIDKLNMMDIGFRNGFSEIFEVNSQSYYNN